MSTGEAITLPERAATWGALAYLVVFGSVVLFILYVFALGRWTASGVSYQFVLFPLVAVALSAWLLDERVTASFALGGALVLAGTYVGALAPPLRRAVESAPAAPGAAAPPPAVVEGEEGAAAEATAAASVCAKC